MSAMDGPRAPLDAEFTSVVGFLDAQLRPQEKWSIASEYPVAFSPGNIGNMRIIKEEDRVLSHAVMRPLIIKTPSGLFKVAGIGSVVTSSEHRNQGLSKQIIDSCLTSATDHGCDFAILWTNIYEFYRKLGFELGGSEISILIERELPADTSGLRFMESNKVAPEAIQRLYVQHTVTSLRTLEETRKYLQIPNMRIYTAWDDKNVLKAYAIEGKGADLNGYIHEWGGGVAALQALFGHVRKVQNRSVTVIAPGHARNLIQKMRELGCPINEGFLGMIKILNSTHLFAKVKRFSRAVGVADLVLEKQGEVYYIGAGENIFKTDSEADIVRLLFGPQKASEIHAFDKGTCEILESLFPLKMWVWGWDSI
jgi:GNAT superfamily N-acetyltransferase